MTADADADSATLHARAMQERAEAAESRLAIIARLAGGEAPMTGNCRCRHPRGWHRHETGSCLECSCLEYRADPTSMLWALAEKWVGEATQPGAVAPYESRETVLARCAAELSRVLELATGARMKEAGDERREDD